MGIKNRIRYYLIEKNGDILREYERISGKGKMRKFFAVLRLNFHYRVLKRRRPLYKDVRAAFKNGAESILSKRPTKEAFLEMLAPFDIVSFDIFDTLILRPLEAPTDVFRILEKRNGCTGFAEMRIRAEREARTGSTSGEINIHDIYKMLSSYGTHLPGGETDELSAEIDYCFPNPYLKDIYDELISRGKDVIIISDMYFPSEMMEKLLSASGYRGYKKLYVSCDFAKNKARGELFSLAKSDFPEKTIIHIGDNASSDVTVPKRLGIAAYHYKSCHEIGAPYRPRLKSALTSSLYSGIINTHFHSGAEEFSVEYERGFALACDDSTEARFGTEEFRELFKLHSEKDPALFPLDDEDRKLIRDFYN